MPACATHYFYAKEIMKHLDVDLVNMINENLSLYELGAQGPDVFFYYKFYQRNEISAYGTNLHHSEAYPIVDKALKRISETNDEKALVYLLGYVAHFVLDSSFHPIINNVCTNFNDHMILETELDRKIIESKSEQKPPFYQRYRLIDNSVVGDSLIKIFPELKQYVIESSIKQMSLILRFLHSPHGIKANLLHFGCRLIKSDSDFSYMIIRKKKNNKYDKVIDELLLTYEDAITLGVKLYQNVIKCYKNQEILDSRFKRDYE